MADLAACYFCGAALDDSLATVSLGDGPDAPTLTLCAGCQDKLETVLAAVDREPGSVSAGSNATESAGSPDPDPEPSGTTAPSPADSAASATDEPSVEPAPSSSEPRGSDTADGVGTDDAAGAGDDDHGEDPGDQDVDQGAADEGGRSIVEGDQEISALEYNKVMRLLQNREFPVDREEIVTVAANAYQVARADCDRVIEAAIDRGILEEADGQLVKPD